MKMSWPGVVALGIVCASAVGAAYVTGSIELALVLAGFAGGILVPGPLSKGQSS